VNGVAKSNAEVSRQIFPGYAVHAVTNGVHASTWTSPSFAEMYEQHVPGWCHEPELLTRADRIPDEALWAAHQASKQALLEKVRELTGVSLALDRPILGFARRMTAYKRADLLFTDINRLKAIAGKFPFQIVMAGKAHPNDTAGKQLIETLHAHIRELAGEIPMAFLPDYDMALALHMVSGSDLWLNTPLRPLEASGTSGMKAAINGCLNFSILDGWWREGYDGTNGFAIGNDSHPDSIEEQDRLDSANLFKTLTEEVIPCFYDRDANGVPRQWIKRIRRAFATLVPQFNTWRMVQEYTTKYYTRRP